MGIGKLLEEEIKGSVVNERSDYKQEECGMAQAWMSDGVDGYVIPATLADEWNRIADFDWNPNLLQIA